MPSRKPLKLPDEKRVSFLRRFRVWFAVGTLALLVLVGLCACRGGRIVRRGSPKCPGPGYTLVTGYCNCGKCCGWTKSWFGMGQPVYNYGPNRGKPKKVGITAKGTPARRGTIAADLKVYPFGTRLKIPGYGTGVVEDVGGAIKGHHIDLWFPSHAEARKWGSRWLKIERVR